MRTNSHTRAPRNALAFLGDKLQAKRDEAFLEGYRRQAHEALAKDPYSTSFSEDPEIIHKNPVVRSTIKYKNQSPGDGSSFSASNQVLYYSPVNPSAEHGRSSNSPRRRQSEVPNQDPASTPPRGSVSITSPRRSMLSRTTATDILARTAASDMSGPPGASEVFGHTSAADKFQSVSSTMQLAAILTSRSSQETRRSSQPITPHSSATSSASRSGDATVHWTALHWDEDMENNVSVKPRLATAHKAVALRPPRPVTAPTPPLPRGDDDDSQSSSSRMNGDGGRFLQASDHVSSWDQLPDSCLRDRCLRPLSKLQQQNFMTSGHEQSPQAEPGGLIWQNSGFLIPFTPDLVTLKRGQSRQISTVLNSGTSVPSLHIPSKASSVADVHRLSSASSRLSPSSQSLPQHASSSAAAARPAATGVPDLSSAAPVRTPSGSLLVQPLSQSQLSDLAMQIQLPTGLQHAASLAALGGGTQQQEGDWTALDGTAAKQGGKRRRRKSNRDRDPAMAHVEEHLRILKHVHVKLASPRTMMMNRRRAEELGLAALPDTGGAATTTSHMSATLGSAPLGRPGTAPASRPVTGQGSWYQTGMHVLPEELNSAVLEALAAEAAGVKLQSSVAGPTGRPATSPTASYKMRMEANTKALVYDEVLDAPNAVPKRTPAINPNRAYLKSLAQGSAKKHFQSVEVDLREAHRRLLATEKDLQPVTYATAAKTHVYAC
ncbi:hypothetical protein WJX77_012691 [Trebouxia sp. C0004]